MSATVLTELSEDSYDLILDDLFELGLCSLLDGYALRLGKVGGQGPG